MLDLSITEDVEVAFTRGPKDREPTQFDAPVSRLPLDGTRGLTFNVPRADKGAQIVNKELVFSDNEAGKADKKTLADIRRDLTSAGDLHDRTVRWQVNPTRANNKDTGKTELVYTVDAKASKKIRRPNRKPTTAPASVDGAPSK